MLSSYYLTWSRLAPTLFWFAIAVILCLTELLLHKKLPSNFKFVPAIAGVISLLISLFVFSANIVPRFNYLIAYWMGLSAASIIWVRPMFLKRTKFSDRDATEAKTMTEILPGKIGRVLYEGSLWQARCDDRTLQVPSNQTVYVLRREGNTLIVAPEILFQL